MQKKIRKWLAGAACIAVLALTVLGGAGEIAQATAGTTYLVTTTASYGHPVTGEVEDSGSNEALGQSMSESVLYQKALLEKMDSGRLYLTMRIFMMDNINNIRVWTQKKSGGSWKKASVKLMQQNVGGDYSADYRFEIAQTSIIVRLKLYVVPMGRDVTFYYTLSNAKKGTGDFVTSVQSQKSSNQKAKAEPTAASVSDSNSTQKAVENKSSDAATNQPKATSAVAAKETENLDSSTSETKDVDSTGIENGVEGGRELLAQTEGLVVSDNRYLGQDASEETASPEETTTESKESAKEETEQFFSLSWTFVFQCILIITVPSLLILGIFFLCFKTSFGRKKIKFFILLGIFVFGTTGCVDQSQGKKLTENTDKMTQKEWAVIATSVATVEICDRLDIPLVGVPESSQFTVPEKYEDLPVIGTPMAVDMEKVISLQPDWILSPVSLLSDLKPQYEAQNMEYAFLNLSSVQGMYKSIEQLGQIFGKEEKAEELVDEFVQYYDEFHARHSGKASPRVLILMGLPGSYVVATPNSYVGNLVELAGGVNVYAGEEDDFINVNPEDMLERKPDIILRTSHALPDKVKEMFAEEFKTNDIWKHFSAVEEGKVYDLSNEKFGMSATFSYPEAIEELEKIFYE